MHEFLRGVKWFRVSGWIGGISGENAEVKRDSAMGCNYINTRVINYNAQNVIRFDRAYSSA